MGKTITEDYKSSGRKKQISGFCTQVGVMANRQNGLSHSLIRMQKKGNSVGTGLQGEEKEVALAGEPARERGTSERAGRQLA